MRLVAYVNGLPRAGKDTMIEMVTAHAKPLGIHVANISSIEPIRYMLTHAGVDLRQKTDADRNLLAAVGKLLEDHSQFRSRQTAAAIVNSMPYMAGARMIVFVHVRERYMMEAITRAIKERVGDVDTTTVFVERDVKLTAQNASDQEVMLPRNYMHRIVNDSTLDELNRRSRLLLDTLIYRHGGL